MKEIYEVYFSTDGVIFAIALYEKKSDASDHVRFIQKKFGHDLLDALNINHVNYRTRRVRTNFSPPELLTLRKG